MKTTMRLAFENATPLRGVEAFHQIALIRRIIKLMEGGAGVVHSARRWKATR